MRNLVVSFVFLTVFVLIGALANDARYLRDHMSRIEKRHADLLFTLEPKPSIVEVQQLQSAAQDLQKRVNALEEAREPAGPLFLQTATCIHCGAAPVIWTGHVHCQDQKVIAGHCQACRDKGLVGQEKYPACQGCFGPWKERDGLKPMKGAK